MLHFDAVGPIVMAPFTFVGHVNVLLPVESWQMVTVKRWPAAAFTSMLLVMFAPKVISIVSPVETSIVELLRRLVFEDFNTIDSG